MGKEYSCSGIGIMTEPQDDMGVTKSLLSEEDESFSKNTTSTKTKNAEWHRNFYEHSFTEEQLLMG